MIRRLLLLAALVYAPVALAGSPPNILLIIIDTLRYDGLACDGNASIQTPTIDGLAAKGLRFERHYANASWTRPSVASILTGQYPHEHGVFDRNDILSLGVPTIGSQLRTAHYRSYAVSANSNFSALTGLAGGFQEFVLFDSFHPTTAITPAVTVIDRVLELLPHVRTPWFLTVLIVDPHEPYHPPAPYDTLYDTPYPHAPTGHVPFTPFIATPATIPSARDRRHYRALYDGEITYADGQLARLLDKIDLHSTLLILTADHGQGLWQHFEAGHGHTVFDTLIHVPLIIAGLTVPHREVTALTESVDLYSTILHVAGVQSDRNGCDLLAPPCPPRTPAVVVEERIDGFDLAAVITGNAKLILDRKTRRVDHYDLQADPGEINPLSPSLDAAAVERIVSEGSTGPQTSGRVNIDERTREQLRSLGYARTGR
jgi:choline-sulfatase